MKRLLPLLLLCGCRAAPATLDTRTPVRLPAEGVEAVRVEMRTMLSSLHDLQLGLAPRPACLRCRLRAPPASLPKRTRATGRPSY